MSTKRPYLVILLMMIGRPQAGIGQDKPAQPANGVGAIVEIDTQLQLNKEALISKGSSEQMRINAANLLLFSSNPLARQILLDALRQADNSAARMAVCKVLAQTRPARKPIENKEDFIKPLFDILANDNSAAARLAAEATLIFEYEQISEQLEEIVANAPVLARLNAVYALRLHPDIRGAIRLVQLLDDPESQVATAAETALHSLGVPVGKDADSRKEIIGELKRKGLAAFLRSRLISQEAEMRKLQTELDLWRQRYLSELGKTYAAISDDAAKSKFFAEHLGGTEIIVKLWALEKLEQWWKGTTKPKLSAELQQLLVSLISEQDRNVRLKTANLLSLMGELNAAQHLLEQLKIEQDDEVRMELFVALGEACFYASLVDSGSKVPDEVRKQALAWAAKYLSQQNPREARKGASVVRKLLEKDGLTAEEVDKYLGLLAERYEQQKNEADDGTLRGDLLSEMAGLCAQSSVCRDQAVKRFRPLFDEALRDNTDLVRQAAVDGFIYIDKADALKRLRKGFVNDPSMIIRTKLMDLAGEVGGQEDLAWLAEKVGATDERELAWQAMLRIFRRSGVGTISEWVAKFDAESTQSRFLDGQRISFFEMAAQKLAGENNPKMLTDVRVKLARLYSKSGQYELAARYFGLLHEGAQTVEQKEAIVPDLLDAFLRWPNLKAAKDLVANCLLKKDLDPNSAVVRVIDNYLRAPPAGTDTRAVLDELSQIETGRPEPRAMWRKQLEQWADQVGTAQDLEERKEARTGAGFGWSSGQPLL